MRRVGGELATETRCYMVLSKLLHEPSATARDQSNRRLIRYAREEVLAFLFAGAAAVAFVILAFAIGP